MTNQDKSLWVVQNGEIYNFRELKQELSGVGYVFRSNCDTEVLLHAYAHWGTQFMQHPRGMFAIALWSEKDQQLLLVRDRFGIKPLYYRVEKHNGDLKIMFASEIKAILSAQVDGVRQNLGIIYDFLAHGLLDHNAETFFGGVEKLPPAHYMLVDRTGHSQIGRYWDFQVNPDFGPKTREGDGRAAESFRKAFLESVRYHLVSDVPIGSCLSGGLDSSAIVCAVNHLRRMEDLPSAAERQQTFTSCFDDQRFDERRYANQVVKKTGVQANFTFPTAKGFLEELPKLLYHQEEPFGGKSIYAQWCLMRDIHRSGLKVVLDGQGGDEQLLGYGKFYLFYLQSLLRQHRYRMFFREAVGISMPPEFWRSLDLKHDLRYIEPLAALAGEDKLVGPSLASRFADRHPIVGLNGNMAVRIKLDLTTFSLPVLLRYEDNNSMAFSVESRVPFVDHILAEYIAALPLNQKLRGRWTKFILREGLKGLLPAAIRQRKSKIGFVTPEPVWFRGELAPVIKDSFSNARFLPEWANLPGLRKAFTNYQRHPMVISHNVFFRYFIMEKWAGQFFP